MLIAEIHGKVVPKARDDEDYLTSSVFGHLRYVRKSIFWEQLFQAAKTIPIEGVEHSLSEIAARQSRAISGFPAPEFHFWPRHATFGIPEMAICFNGGAQRPLVILVEVKLWSMKHGEGENDQLKRYLQIADDIAHLPKMPHDAVAFVVYLYFPRECVCHAARLSSLSAVA